MAHLARQLRQDQQKKQTIQAPKIVKNENQKRWISPGEKVLSILFGALVCFGSIHIISNQSSIYELNAQIQDTKSKVQEIQKSNSDLAIQVSELSQYERIRAKAKELGLKLNEKSVKVVQE